MRMFSYQIKNNLPQLSVYVFYAHFGHCIHIWCFHPSFFNAVSQNSHKIHGWKHGYWESGLIKRSNVTANRWVSLVISSKTLSRERFLAGSWSLSATLDMTITVIYAYRRAVSSNSFTIQSKTLEMDTVIQLAGFLCFQILFIS